MHRTTVGQALGRAWRWARWWVRELSGESAYDKYLVNHARLHPGQPPLGERAFWRAKADDAERRPIQRCC